MSRLVTLADGRQVAINNLDTTIDELGINVRDAFYRLKVSQPSTLLDIKQTSPASNLFYSTAETSGSGTSLTYNPNKSSSTLSVSANTAGTRVIQSRQRTNYQPGKSQDILLTAIIGIPKTGVTKRLGYFDENNGIFFEFTNTTIYLVIRSKTSGSIVDTKIARENWNGDKLDGNGPSGMNIDLDKGQIYFMFFEWLGVGTVWFGVFHKGEPVILHEQHHNNIVTAVYMGTPVLPIRAEITNNGSGAADSMEVICGSVTSQGGVEKNGANRAVSRGNSAFLTANDQGVYYPLISLRINSLYKSTEIWPSSFRILSTSASIFEVVTLINPTINGTDNASWVTVPNSSLQYDISRDNTNSLTFTSGQVLSSSYGDSNLAVSNQDIQNFWTIGSSVDGTSDEFVLAVANIGASRNETFYASINFKEIL